MRKHNNRFRMEKIGLVICTAMLVVTIGILIGKSIAEKPAWDVCYDMANRNIEWLQAGR